VARDHRERDDAEAPHVRGGAVVALAADDLGRRVRGRAAVHVERAAVREDSREACSKQRVSSAAGHVRPDVAAKSESTVNSQATHRRYRYHLCETQMQLKGRAPKSMIFMFMCSSMSRFSSLMSRCATCNDALHFQVHMRTRAARACTGKTSSHSKRSAIVHAEAT
jgi:hypothetical protein